MNSRRFGWPDVKLAIITILLLLAMWFSEQPEPNLMSVDYDVSRETSTTELGGAYGD
jgi:hypothetical protein